MNFWRRSYPVLSAFACAALISACSVLNPLDNRAARQELDAAAERWAAAGLDSYTITVERMCYCGQEALGPVDVVVQNGEITARTYRATGEPVREPYAPHFHDVDGLFDLIRDAIAEADSISADYHARDGFPLEVRIDYMKNAVDDELTVRIVELVVEE